MGYISAPGVRIGAKTAPFMASFSSVGPNVINPEILKVLMTSVTELSTKLNSFINCVSIFQPDITAPGVNIIAAYTEAVSPTEQPFDKRRVKFNVLSGTSMSCPHVSGVVGLLKSLYPDWSPAAIKSAIMTTGKSLWNSTNKCLRILC